MSSTRKRPKTAKKTRAVKRDYFHPQFHVVNVGMFNIDVALAVNLSEHQTLKHLVRMVNKHPIKDYEREKRFFEEVLPQLEGWDDKTSGGRCITTTDGAGFVVLLKFRENCFRHSIAVLAHELTHVVHYALRRRRVPLSVDTEEVYAYMLDDLMEMSMIKLWD